MVDVVQEQRVAPPVGVGPNRIARRIVWALLVLLSIRFAVIWFNAFAATSLPVPGRIGFTVMFTIFSLVHATTLLGRRRAMAFLGICAAVSWSFEEIGILTGRIYGPYHYGDQLGPKLGAVPILIPFAWFMMVYASWIVARLLLGGASDASRWPASLARVVVAAMVMTSWDTIMDPGMARAGVWTWEEGGVYFGVPLQNFVGWLVTTLAVYAVAEIAFRLLPGRSSAPGSKLYAGLPALVYAMVAVDRLLLPDLPELRVVAGFGMTFIALLAILRLALPERA